MAVLRLTDLAIQHLKLGLYYDEKTPAFGLRVGVHRKNSRTRFGRDREAIERRIGEFLA